MSSDRILYRFFDSPVGEMIAGATDDGICFLEWQDRGGVPRILKRVEKRYGLPLVEGNHRHVDALVSELAEYFDGGRKAFAVPLDVRGTPFQRLAWEQLRRIPYGTTVSYGEQARAVGRPTASRAVARANGDNYLSVIIPCHRVIDSNGDLRGYGGGLWRKEWLLTLEGAYPKKPIQPSFL